MSRIGSRARAAKLRGALKMGRMAAAAATVAALALVGAGCGSSGGSDSTNAGSGTTAKKPFTVGLMLPTLETAFFADQAKQMQKIVAERGGKVVIGDADSDPVKQLQIVQDWLNAGTVDAVVGGTLDVLAFQPALDQAAQQKTPVVLLGGTPQNLHDGQALVTQDFKQWGVVAGEAMARCVDERLGGRAEVVILGGPNRPGPVVVDRLAGIKEGLAANAPAAKIVAEQDGDDERLRSLQVMQTILKAHPNVNAFGSSGDDGMLGVLQALKNAGKDPKRMCLIGMNSIPEGLDALRSGDFYAEGDLHLAQIYTSLVDAAQALIANPDDPKYSKQIIRTQATMIYQ